MRRSSQSAALDEPVDGEGEGDVERSCPSGSPFSLQYIKVEDEEKLPNAQYMLLKRRSRRWCESRGRQILPPPLSEQVEALIKEWFGLVDQNNSGHLSRAALSTALKEAEIPHADEAIKEVLEIMDFNRDHKIDWQEFHTFISYAAQDGQDLVKGMLLLPSGRALPLATMIHKIRRKIVLDEVKQGGRKRELGVQRAQQYIATVNSIKQEDLRGPQDFTLPYAPSANLSKAGGLVGSEGGRSFRREQSRSRTQSEGVPTPDAQPPPYSRNRSQSELQEPLDPSAAAQQQQARWEDGGPVGGGEDAAADTDTDPDVASPVQRRMRKQRSCAKISFKLRAGEKGEADDGCEDLEDVATDSQEDPRDQNSASTLAATRPAALHLDTDEQLASGPGYDPAQLPTPQAASPPSHAVPGPHAVTQQQLLQLEVKLQRARSRRKTNFIISSTPCSHNAKVGSGPGSAPGPLTPLAATPEGPASKQGQGQGQGQGPLTPLSAPAFVTMGPKPWDQEPNPQLGGGGEPGGSSSQEAQAAAASNRRQPVRQPSSLGAGSYLPQDAPAPSSSAASPSISPSAAAGLKLPNIVVHTAAGAQTSKAKAMMPQLPGGLGMGASMGNPSRRQQLMEKDAQGRAPPSPNTSTPPQESALTPGCGAGMSPGRAHQFRDPVRGEERHSRSPAPASPTKSAAPRDLALAYGSSPGRLSGGLVGSRDATDGSGTRRNVTDGGSGARRDGVEGGGGARPGPRGSAAGALGSNGFAYAAVRSRSQQLGDIRSGSSNMQVRK